MSAALDLSVGVLGSFLILNLDSEKDIKVLAYNAGTVLAARLLVDLLQIYMLGRLHPLLELALASAIWAGLHYALNPAFSPYMLQRLLPGTIISLLALQRALGICN